MSKTGAVTEADTRSQKQSLNWPPLKNMRHFKTMQNGICMLEGNFSQIYNLRTTIL